MNDLLPSNIEQWQKVESVARDHFRRAGIAEIRTPIIEQTELFTRGIGEATEVVGKEMYSFDDRGNRSCTLRPEGTASVVRAVIQNGLLNQGVQRLWYEGPMFRYERPQAGRQRQFHQIGVEFFGSSSVKSDVELISIAWDLLKNLGLNGLKLELNSLGTSQDRNDYRIKLVSWIRKYADFLDQESLNQLENNPLRILDSKKPEIQEMLLEAPLLSESLEVGSRDRFKTLQDILERLDIPFFVNPKLVRGLDYYCHTAFEITSNKLGSQSTVCGGGRYDRLVEQLGGPSTPAIGFAIGMERLLMLLSEKFLEAECPNVYIVNRGSNAEIEALLLARQLRAANFTVELDSSGAAFSKQFKRADRSLASWAIVIGEDEFQKGAVILKRLKNKDNYSDEFCLERKDFDKICRTINS